MRVLWIDDNVPFLRVQQRMLRARHEVRTATTAGEAFAILASERFDVILCDVNLPGMSGPVFFEKLSPLDAARVIFVTGGTCEDADFLEAHHALFKPFTQRELQMAMNGIIAATAA
jgi:CheY-like chemotaxis protein